MHREILDFNRETLRGSYLPTTYYRQRPRGPELRDHRAGFRSSGPALLGVHPLIARDGPLMRFQRTVSSRAR
jgi:hypothetical protein